MLQPSQIRAARAALDWSAEALSRNCGVARRTLLKLENAETLPNVTLATLNAVKFCFEAQGIEFITAPDGSPGIIIRTPAGKT